jgi:zinc transporter ZupT
MDILSYFLLFITIILSGSSIFAFKRVNTGFLKLLLSFSGAYLFALTVSHLIPAVYSSGGKNIGVYVFIGFFLQIILEFFSEGIEHGHIHIHKKQNAAFPYGVMIGLCLHSFLEGIPLVQNFSEAGTQKSLLTGIIMHHIPVAVALMTMLIQSGLSRPSAIVYLTIFALMAPLGAFSGNYIHTSGLIDLPLLFDKIMAIVIGIFLHISTTILFETNEGHRFNYLKLLTIIVGAGLALIS